MKMHGLTNPKRTQYNLVMLTVVTGIHGRTDHDQQHCYHHVPTVNYRLLLQLIGS